MSKALEVAFVLWGDWFEEAIATIFLTELRKAGIRVKVIGVTGRRTSGVSGLVLVPDLTLDEALSLARNAICVVVPCRLPVIERLSNDPRLTKFIEAANANNALFLISEEQTNPNGLFSEKRTMIYPEIEALVPFVRDVARRLS